MISQCTLFATHIEQLCNGGGTHQPSLANLCLDSTVNAIVAVQYKVKLSALLGTSESEENEYNTLTVGCNMVKPKMNAMG